MLASEDTLVVGYVPVSASSEPVRTVIVTFRQCAALGYEVSEAPGRPEEAMSRMQAALRPG
jgi:hypothetical protein